MFCAYGWVPYRTLQRREGAAALSDITAAIGAIGGAAVMALFKSDSLFGLYCIGLEIGFFAYFVIGLSIFGKKATDAWMGRD